MLAWCPEIGHGIADRPDAVHCAHFFSIDLPKERPGSAIVRMPRTDALADTPLAPCDVVHTDPQLLFVARSADQIMLAREPRTS